MSGTDLTALQTGDLCVREPKNGLYYIVGRAKEMIIRGGENIATVQVRADRRVLPAVPTHTLRRLRMRSTTTRRSPTAPQCRCRSARSASALPSCASCGPARRCRVRRTSWRQHPSRSRPSRGPR
jgi:hypothetical protein